MQILCAGLTDVGRKRPSNQDSIYLNHEHRLYIVADGMGGHRGGDIASQLAVKSLPEYILSHANDGDPVEVLKGAVKFANQSILNYSQKNPHLQGMGTTVVINYFKDAALYVANVGDSRAYLVNNGLLYQLSKDHSLVQEKINLGLYTRDDAAKDKMKNVLVRTVGYEPNLDVDVFTYKISKNDIFFICSDGLHGKASDRDMLFLINRNIPGPAEANPLIVNKTVRELIDLANNNGGQDNISVILSIVQ